MDLIQGSSAIAIQKSRELYQTSRETGKDFEKSFLQYFSFMPCVHKRNI